MKIVLYFFASFWHFYIFRRRICVWFSNRARREWWCEKSQLESKVDFLFVHFNVNHFLTSSLICRNSSVNTFLHWNGRERSEKKLKPRKYQKVCRWRWENYIATTISGRQQYYSATFTKLTTHERKSITLSRESRNKQFSQQRFPSHLWNERKKERKTFKLKLHLEGEIKWNKKKCWEKPRVDWRHNEPERKLMFIKFRKRKKKTFSASSLAWSAENLC